MTRSDEQKEQEELRQLLAAARPPVAVRGPQPIAEIISRLMARRGYAQEQMECEWSVVWTSAVGSSANQSRPGKFNRGVLEIVVRNSAELQELTFRKKQLLRAVQAQVPHFTVKDLRFRVGELK